jgi:hypothetical protein
MILVSSWSDANVYNGAVALPTHAAGDLIVITAVSGGSGISTAMPSDWTTDVLLNTTTVTFALARKFAASSAEPDVNVSRWLQLASQWHVFVFRPDSDYVLQVGSRVASSAVTTADITYPGLSLGSAKSRVLNLGYVRNADGNLATAPNGSTAQMYTLSTAGHQAQSFLSGPTATWPVAVITVGGTTGTGRQRAAISVEIEEVARPRSFSPLRLGML